MKIRLATEKDIKAILDIFNYELINTHFVYIYKAKTLDEMLAWFHEKKEKNHPLLVAEINQKVVGYATYGMFRSFEAYHSTKEYSIYIHKDFRKQKIAFSLFENLKEKAKENNIHMLIGGVDSENYPSIKFHQKMGFKEIAHFSEVAYKMGAWRDCKFFELKISEST